LKAAKAGILNWEITPVNLGEKEGNVKNRLFNIKI
jgi:hypothetical protein